MAGRGSDPKDGIVFSGPHLQTLQRAARDVVYLVNQNYPLKSALRFVSDHYLLSERQRIALMRSVATKNQLDVRAAKQMPLTEVHGRTVHIDGFNTIITLETYLCGSYVFVGMDGAFRDLAGLRGSYRLIEETPEAIGKILAALSAVDAAEAVFYLDAPVSNSGRLMTCIAEVWEAAPDGKPVLDVQIVASPDRLLKEKNLIVSSDGIILDAAPSWINLNAQLIPEDSPQLVCVATS